MGWAGVTMVDNIFESLEKPKNWKFWVLAIAGLYNALWGAWVIIFPKQIFEILSMSQPQYLEIWQCVGMIVAVYGIGYFIAAFNPVRYWPIILVGLLGKLLGPIGFAKALYENVFPIEFGINILFNDIIWWIPFTIILLDVFKKPGKQITHFSTSDIDQMPDRKRAKLINSLSGFKSCNLIGTKNSQGETNISIISSAFHLGSNPPLLGFIIRPDSAPRHTLDNLRETKVCTFNHVNEDLIKKAHQTSARYQRHESEFDQCGITEEYIGEFQAPFAKESHIKASLKLIREYQIEENGTHMIIAKVQDIYLPSEVLKQDGHINLELAKTACVSGLDSYHQTSHIGRLSYAKPNTKSSWI